MLFLAEGAITWGGFVTAIARRVDMLTNTVLDGQTDMTRFVRLDANTCRGMGIVLKLTDKELC